jgi:hypothetical protein
MEAGELEICPRTEKQASASAGLPGDHRPAMARIRLRRVLLIGRNGRLDCELHLQPPQRLPWPGASLWSGRTENCAKTGSIQPDLCLLTPSCVWLWPPCASARARMSSMGFFHSRFCAAMADAECWAFIVGASFIHPPNETAARPIGCLCRPIYMIAVQTLDP